MIKIECPVCGNQAKLWPNGTIAVLYHKDGLNLWKEFCHAFFKKLDDSEFDDLFDDDDPLDDIPFFGIDD